MFKVNNKNTWTASIKCSGNVKETIPLKKYFWFEKDKDSIFFSILSRNLFHIWDWSADRDSIFSFEIFEFIKLSFEKEVGNW